VKVLELVLFILFYIKLNIFMIPDIRYRVLGVLGLVLLSQVLIRGQNRKSGGQSSEASRENS
jgi:hypothetical protein